MCLHVALCSIPFNLICNMTTFSLKCFDLLTSPQGSRVFVRTEYVLVCCCIRHSLKFDMQHDHDLIKLNLDLLTLPRGKGRRSAGKIFATMLLYEAFPSI